MKKLLSLTVLCATTLIATTASSSPVDGARSGSGSVSYGQYLQESLVLRAREKTEIRIYGDANGGDLDCTLQDENGNVVVRDIRVSDMCVIDIVPAWTGVFTLTLTNASRRPSFYTATIR
jgi:hypothetical protein